MVVTEVEIITTRHGVIEVEAFVGGTANPWVGQYDAEQLNEGWVSLGVSQGFAPAPADSRPFSLSSPSPSPSPSRPSFLALSRTRAHVHTGKMWLNRGGREGWFAHTLSLLLTRSTM